MIAISRMGNVSQSLMAVICLAGGLGACTSQEVNNNDAGTGKGGSTGSAGSTGSGGSGSTALDNGVLCPPVGMALITDFTYDPDGGAADSVRWGMYGTALSGGTSQYPAAFASDVTGNEWHLSGTISDYSGFGIYFDHIPWGTTTDTCNKFDASAYAGISFTVWGTISADAPTKEITLGVSTVDDTVKPEWLDSVDAGVADPTKVTPGRCMPSSGNGPYYHPGCTDPSFKFAVTGTKASPQTVSVKWTDFSGGSPRADVSPTEITAIGWQLPLAAGLGMSGMTVTPYMADLHIDNLKFIAK